MSKLSKTSHRAPLKRKFTVAKKVKAHDKRQKKLAKKGLITPKKGKKDPGIPNKFPYKLELLQQIQAEKEEARRKVLEDRREETKQRLIETHADEISKLHPQIVASELELATDSILAAQDQSHLQSLAVECAKKQSEFVTKQNASAPIACPEFGPASLWRSSSRRAFFKGVHEVINKADVLVYVVDARDPLGCRDKDIEAEVLRAGKFLVIVLNKVDLVPKEVLLKWLTYFKRENIAVIPFRALTGVPKDGNTKKRAGLKFTKISATKADASVLKSGCCPIGAQNLMQLLNSYMRRISEETFAKSQNQTDDSTSPILGDDDDVEMGENSENNKKQQTEKKNSSTMSISVGIVGLPNVGKSSVINTLCRSTTVVKVGGDAGVTRAPQRIRLTKNIFLIDTPGVVTAGGESKIDNIMRNAIRISSIEEPVECVAELVKKLGKLEFMRAYEVPAFETVNELVAAVGRKAGKLSGGGKINLKSAALSILKDFMEGRKLKSYNEPPTDLEADIEIVTKFAPEFRLLD